jgi:thiosulfate/3-mercaptopyruvate sulfurtransferase
MKMRMFLWPAAVLSLTMAVRSHGSQPPTTGAPPPLVAHDELQKRLADPALRLIDARPRADYDSGHIPGAVWLDPKVFEPLTRGEATNDRAAWGRVLAPLGVGTETEILVYDDDRYHLQAGRVWFWLSYAADARAVGLIDGSFSSWLRAGRPVSTAETRVAARDIGITFRTEQLALRQDVQSATLVRSFQLVDARSEDEYLGKGVCPISRKPLPGGRAGHLPSAKLLEADKVVREDGTFLEPAALRALVSQAGIETDQPIIVYSKGGARSNATVFALRRLGAPVRHYVSGLNEWALDPTLPLVTTSEPRGAN